MSVINQVLNQLEQRGEHTPPEQTMVRVVPQGKRRLTLPLLAVALVLASGIAAWQWAQMRKPVLSPVEGQAVVAAKAVQAPPAAALPAPLPEPASAVAVMAVSADSPASAVSAEELPPAEMLAPASRLSFELSSIPLPSTLRQGSAGHETKAVPARDDAEKRPVGATMSAKQSSKAASHSVRPAAPSLEGASPMKQVSPAQRADAEFRKAVALMQQGHITDAIAGYEAVLRLDAGHDAARQALVALLLESKRGADAGRVLRDGLKNRPEHTGFAMLLARLQVEQGAVEQAAATLEKSLPYADAQADYQAFFAALMQRRNRHKEAITHYQIALQLVPGNGIWLMGYGISLLEVQRTDEAGEAFRRALESGTLNPELQAFVRQKIKEL